MEPQFIRIRGARMHNLKNIDADLPRNRLVVFTGLSGSGKSSLAFDTLYAEGQRRYVESLSTYARQFLGQMDKPEVDSLEGLSPAVAIEQRTTGRNPRSTVGTITEIYDHLRLLFARVGRPHCPKCGEEIRPRSVQEMVDELLGSPEGTKLILLAPLVNGQAGDHRALLAGLRRDGYARVRVDGGIRSLDEEIALDPAAPHSIAAVVDRLVVKESVARRLADSVATAVALAGGRLLVHFADDGSETLYSEQALCARCGCGLPELAPQLFSFNSPRGACETCGGLGVSQFFDPELVVPDLGLSLRDGAIAPWGDSWSRSGKGGEDDAEETSRLGQLLAALADHFRFDLDTPFAKLDEGVRGVLLHGSGNEEITVRFHRGSRRESLAMAFEGVLPQLERRYRETTSEAVREDLEQYLTEQPCPACHGARLRPEALAVRVGDRSIADFTTLAVADLARELDGLVFRGREERIARRILTEVGSRLGFLADVGLGYLSLDRRAASLSGGEAQRIRLAAQIGSQLVGVLYILDEPSIGLHQRDNERLLACLARLRDLGNTVVVVEHDHDTIRAADHVLDMGPGAGRHGGEVLYSGPVAGLLAERESLTGGFLSGRLTIPVPSRQPLPGRDQWLTVRDARTNNLTGITARFPLGRMTCVTGVSGSGKSSLVIETLFRSAQRHLRQGQATAAMGCAAVEGLDRIDKVIDIDQSAIGRTPRSNPATYAGVLAPVRELLARLPEARARGYRANRFSFNVKGGRCEACQGEGSVKITMHFLPDLYVTCDTCRGRRYNQETLEIKYRGRNIAEILAMTVDEALAFFAKVPAIRNRLATLAEVGLGYLGLGQSSVTLSGGEAQRLKLARELSRRATGRTLYILDEPTTGLHPADIRHLLNVLARLTERGNTVVVIEHNLDVIKCADQVIDLGPEGGEAGGRLVVAGSPEEVAACPESHTGAFLRPLLAS